MSTPGPIRRQASVREEGTSYSLDVNQSIWAPSSSPTSENVWELATVMAVGELKVTVRTSANKVIQIDRGSALPQNPRLTNDMTALYYIHEAGVLYNLAQRSGLADGPKPYTFMANVLIAVNPLQKIADPCLQDILSSASTVPHPFSVAEMAYQQMIYNSSSTEMPTNQSVVISGESGAGKTESSKIVLKHLTSRGVFGKNADVTKVQEYVLQSKHDTNSLDSRLIEQNPILEAFGNAKTLRNHNSSRFGKFMKLQFTNDGKFKLAGAFVETYLLEKSRLVYQVDGERNFHIFYQLLNGGTSKMRSEMSLLSADQYHYLNQSNCYTAEETDDTLQYNQVTKGLNCIGMGEEEQFNLFGAIAGLLHLGNVEFDEEETPEGEAAIVSSKAVAQQGLDMASKLLGLQSEKLFKVITEREIVTRDETFTVRRNAQNAGYVRDAIAKSLYGRIFDWIIERVNTALGQDPLPLPYIGVLDIFGFESFQRNDFEQLLINYTNEVLQATFNNQVFIAEMELYKREGITVGKIDWPDNRECVDLIAGKPHGILQLLDNEAANPKPSDQKFLALLHRTHTKNPYFPRPHPKDMQEVFIVRHFAGFVSYTVGAFIDKNNDTIPKDMADLFLSSQKPIISNLFQNEAKESSAAVGRVKKSRAQKSVAAKFSRQMRELVDTLDATRCNFIRCIKPNALMRLGYFDDRYVVGQLRCQGIMQTAQVLKVGLPTRVAYMELVGAYKKYMPPDAMRLFHNQSDQTLISAILWAFQVPMDAFKLGITKLFFKAGKIALLDGILKLNWAVDGPRIVSRMKLWLARRRWRVGLAKVISQLALLKLLKKIQCRGDAVTRVQLWWRGFRVKRVFQIKKKAVVRIQALFRGHLGRLSFKSRKQEMLAASAARAEQMRLQAIEAKRREEEAMAAAIEARNLALREAEMESERQKMEEEVAKAEQEAKELALAASIAMKEAEDAAAEAAAAVEHERSAEARALREAEELEAKMAEERQLAQKRKEEALLAAANVSATLLGGLATVTTRTGASGGEVHVVEDIPDHISQENREQLEQLNELLLGGSINQSEYDELVPFLLEEDRGSQGGGQLTQQQIEEEENLNRLYAQGAYGIQIRCPACGVSNNTANGNHCNECGSQLTAGAASHSTQHQSLNHRYYGYRTRSMSQQNFVESGSGGGLPMMNEGGGALLTSPPGHFSMDNSMNPKVLIHDGYFECSMHGSQVLADENYTEYTVYVLRCSWRPMQEPVERDIDDNCDEATPKKTKPTFWLVSHRFSVFERLNKDLKAKIPAHVAILPSFPRKHRLGGVFGGKTGNSNEIVEERKAGLDQYVRQVIDLCARLPSSVAVPELDRFLGVSRQVEQIKRKRAQEVMAANLEARSAAAGGEDGSNELAMQMHEQQQQMEAGMGNISLNPNMGGAEALAAREQSRLPSELPTPLDEDELSQMEHAVSSFQGAIRSSTGDLRRNRQVQGLLQICVQLQPRLQVSASVDNPFADVELIPRAMQCQEDLETTMGLYNDSLLAITETFALSDANGGNGNGGMGGPPAPFVPGQQQSYYGRGGGV